MFTLLLVLLVLDALVLIPVVLLQSGKGGGLAAMGGGAGTDTLFGSRQATTILHKASWWAGGIFVALAFALSILSSRPQRASSVLRQGLQQGAPVAPARTSPAVGVTQGPAAQNQAQGTGPAAPATPAPAATQGGNDPATANAGSPAPNPATTPAPANQQAPRP
ncbi:MAG TPA: preprotein translocase subunit SecG [Longimicrobium sp.]|nr:preprotein translocase subunit SecG [Longimicrobium sp.]